MSERRVHAGGILVATSWPVEAYTSSIGNYVEVSVPLPAAVRVQDAGLYIVEREPSFPGVVTTATGYYAEHIYTPMPLAAQSAATVEIFAPRPVEIASTQAGVYVETIGPAWRHLHLAGAYVGLVETFADWRGVHTSQVGIYVETGAYPMATAVGAQVEVKTHWPASVTLHDAGAYVAIVEGIPDPPDVYATQAGAYTEQTQPWPEGTAYAARVGNYIEIRGDTLLTTATGVYSEFYPRGLDAAQAGGYLELTGPYITATEVSSYLEAKERFVQATGFSGYLEAKENFVGATGLHGYVEAKLQQLSASAGGVYVEIRGDTLLDTRSGAYLEQQEQYVRQTGARAMVEFRQRRIRVSAGSAYVEASDKGLYQSAGGVYVEIAGALLNTGAGAYVEQKGEGIWSTRSGVLIEGQEHFIQATQTGVYAEQERHQVNSAATGSYIETSGRGSLITFLGAYMEQDDRAYLKQTQAGSYVELGQANLFVTGSRLGVEIRTRFVQSSRSAVLVEGQERFIQSSRSGVYLDGKYDELAVSGQSVYIEGKERGPRMTYLGAYVDADQGPFVATTTLGIYVDHHELPCTKQARAGVMLELDPPPQLTMANGGAYVEFYEVSIRESRLHAVVELEQDSYISLTALGRTAEASQQNILTLTALGRTVELQDKHLHLTALGRTVEVQDRHIHLTAAGRYIEAAYHTVGMTFLAAYMERERTRPIETIATRLGAYYELAAPEIRATQTTSYVEWKRRGVMAQSVGTYVDVQSPHISALPPVGQADAFIELHTRCRDMYRVIVEWETYEGGQLSGDALPADLDGFLQPVRGVRARYYQGIFVAYRENDRYSKFIQQATVNDLKMLWREGSRVLFMRHHGILDRAETDCVKVYWAGDLEIEWVAADLPFARIPFTLVEIL